MGLTERYGSALLLCRSSLRSEAIQKKYDFPSHIKRKFFRIIASALY
ncbi:hypothetical protein [Azospirillum palustre]